MRDPTEHTLDLELPWPPATLTTNYGLDVMRTARQQEPRLTAKRGRMRGSLALRVIAHAPAHIDGELQHTSVLSADVLRDDGGGHFTS